MLVILSCLTAVLSEHHINPRQHITTQSIPQQPKTVVSDVTTAPLIDSAQNSHCGTLSGPGECSLTDDVFLKTSLIELGIHYASSLGSASNIPPEHGYSFSNHCPADCRLGFICDYDADGLDVGYPPYSGDYFVPGTPVEGWTLQYTTRSGTSTFTNAGLLGMIDIPPDSIRITSDDTTQQQSVWTGHTDHVTVTVTTTVPYGKQVFHVDTCITNNIDEDLIGLYLMRNVDPDQTVQWNNDYDTYNYVKFQPAVFGYPEYVSPDDPTLAVVVARGIEGYEKFVLALGAADSRAFVTHGGFDNFVPTEFYNSNQEWLSYGGANVQLTDLDRMSLLDEGIQVVYREDSVSPGEEVCFRTFFGLSIGFEAQLPDATNTPTPGPIPGCRDQPHLITCEVLSSFDSCSDVIHDHWGQQFKVRELCPNNCRCVTTSEGCICDDDETLRHFAYRHGLWVKSCEIALQYVTCDTPYVGKYLKQYCPVSCPSDLNIPSDPSEGPTPEA